MHIAALFLNNEVRTGGHRRLLELLEELASRGNTVSVLLNSTLSFKAEFFDAIPVDCTYKRGGLIPISVSFSRALRRNIDLLDGSLRNAEALMIHGETHLSAARYLKKRLNIPILYAHRSNTVREALISLRDPDLKPLQRLRCLVDIVRFHFYERRIVRHCEALVFQSPFDRDDFVSRNRDSASKTHVIRGNIGLPRFKPETEGINHSSSLRRLLFVGTLGNRKGLRHLLRAMELLRDRGAPPLHLDILGPGDSRDYWEQWLRDRKLDEHVILHGRVANPFTFLAKADLLVVPSDFDSYPDTVLEALHVGIPVIGSQAGGIPDMLQYPELLFPVQDAEAIAGIIGQAASDSACYRRLRDLCLSRREDFHFNWAAEWEKVLQEII